ncbi:MAG: ArsR family transcriptional regulator, partial [Rhodospirillales bacterium]|nr:ArsR family transcriptional regulator [Rhodospirillales bacterium]
MKLENLQDRAAVASKLLKAMSNQHRLMILCQLVQGEKCVGEL